MEIQSLNITNLATFKGKHTFDLKPRKGPIVLIGGKNGSGKTNLMEAIKLCLYGRAALGSNYSKQAYEDHLESLIHKNPDATVPLNSASISLDFSNFRSGELQQYNVDRSWQINGTQTKEHLRIQLNGSLMMGLPPERWQDFLHDLVPPGLTELFFFDGEKIQSLAKDIANPQGSHERRIGTAIKKLLSLDVIEQLETDLNVYAYRKLKETTAQSDKPDLENLLQSRAAIELELENLICNQATTQKNIDANARSTEETERNIAAESQGYYTQQVDLKVTLESHSQEVDSIKNNIREMATELLPFSLIPELCTELADTLATEAGYTDDETISNAISLLNKDIQKQMNTDEFWENTPEALSTETRLALKKNISELFQAAPTLPSPDTFTPIHDLSSKESSDIKSWVQASKIQADTAIKLGNQLEYLTRKRDNLSQKLQEIPDDLGVILKSLRKTENNLRAEKAKLELEFNSYLEAIRQVEYKIEEHNRDITKAYAETKTTDSSEEKLKLLPKVQKVLNQFQANISRAKTTQLEALVTQRFTELIRKNDLSLQIKIDPETYLISVLDSNGLREPSKALSAGEREIFAIAVLWALRQLSGRPLPVIIDTPLARLDGEHRTNMIEKYFPYTSHQVIIFSTDTEVDQGFFKDLEPNISHTYQLEYNDQQHETLVTPGYFWELNNGSK